MGISKVIAFLAIFSSLASLVFADNNGNGNNNDNDNNGNGNGWGNSAHRDVCIVGGGAAGASAAVFLRDRNFSVVVIEKQSNLGGHCDTVNWSPPIPVLPPWVDIGVAFWPDTAKLNAVNLGPWDVDSAAFSARFGGAPFFVDLSQNTNPTYNLKFADGTNYGLAPRFPPQNPSQGYLDAWDRYFNIVNNTYHWISLNEYPTNWYPDRIPNDLLQPFSSWIHQHDLEDLLPVFQAFLNPSGIGSWDSTPAIWCVLAVPPSILQSIKVANTGFIVTGGCQVIYNGIATFLGSSNVVYNSVVSSAKRKSNGNKPIKLDVTNTQTGAESRFTCDKLIIAHPQTTQNLQYADLDILEELVFDQVRTRYYFNGIATATGGSLAPFGGFTFRNFDTANAFGQPTFPGLITLSRSLPLGPVSILGSSDTPLTNAAFSALASAQIARLPAALLTASVNFTTYHEYQPYPVTDAVNHPFGFYTQLRALQGHRNTYYIGTLASYAGSYLVWEQAYDLIKREFA